MSSRALEDARLLRLIRASLKASHGIYGSPRVFLNLREAGETCSKHRVARLMRVNKIRALHGYRTRHYSVAKPAVIVPDLIKRNFDVTRPNKICHGYYVHPDMARLAVSRGRNGSIFQTGDRMGHRAESSSRARLERSHYGGEATSSQKLRDPFRPGIPTRQRLLEALLSNQSSRAEHEQKRKLLGQRGR